MSAIDLTLQALTRLAWRIRLDPKVYLLARRLTDPEASRQAKMEAIVDELHRRPIRTPDPTPAESFAVNYDRFGVFLHLSRPLDADDACLFVAATAMSVGIRCRIVGARYGNAWTCAVDYAVGDHWETIDPLRQRPEREPDERVLGPLPDENPSPSTEESR